MANIGAANFVSVSARALRPYKRQRLRLRSHSERVDAAAAKCWYLKCFKLDTAQWPTQPIYMHTRIYTHAYRCTHTDIESIDPNPVVQPEV